MYFLIKSTSAFSLENSDVGISPRTGDGIGASSGKMSDGRDVSFGKVLPSFSTIKYEFFPLCSLFLSLLALRGHIVGLSIGLLLIIPLFLKCNYK